MAAIPSIRGMRASMRTTSESQARAAARTRSPSSASPEARADPQVSSGGLDPAPQAAQPLDPGLALGEAAVRVVVAHPQDDAVGGAGELHEDAAGIGGVLDGVGDPLLRHPVEGQLGLGSEADHGIGVAAGTGRGIQHHGRPGVGGRRTRAGRSASLGVGRSGAAEAGEASSGPSDIAALPDHPAHASRPMVEVSRRIVRKLYW